MARRCARPRRGDGPTSSSTTAAIPKLAHLAYETGLDITVCHLPPGASKWNKIEHRLFSHIWTNGRGRPLESHEVIVNTIAETTSRTGPTVLAEMDTRNCAKGIEITTSSEGLERHASRRHDFCGEWNYALVPQRTHDPP